MSVVLSNAATLLAAHPFLSLSLGGLALYLVLNRGRMEIFGAETVEQPKFTLVYSPPGLTSSDPSYFEIRRYHAQIRAQTTYMVPRGERRPRSGDNGGFMTIARYIFGSNKKRVGTGNEKVDMTAPVLMEKQESQKIAMTAPVLMEKQESQKIAMTAPVLMEGQVAKDASAGPDLVPMTMSFIMPSQYKSIADLPEPMDSRVKLVEVPEYTVAVLRRSGSLTATLSVKMEKELRELVAKDGKYKLAETGSTTAGYNPPWTLPWFRRNEMMIPVV